ncbi:hypothetical protein AQ749_18330 [Burkholderia pseudomallei]|nr:hypothetical protein AQ749_18330 [Burkholderia pseudomallei]ONA18074.1 hypothetical protein AQ877_24270 [Burkholderia pseudomallei]
MARRRSNRGGGQPGGGCDTDPARPSPAQPGTSTSTSTSISTCTSSSSSSIGIGNNDNDNDNDNIIGGGISHGDESRVMGSR